MNRTPLNKKKTAQNLNDIVDAPVTKFPSGSVMKQAHLLRLAADRLNSAEPATLEVLAVVHQLSSWANDLEESLDNTDICNCGNTRGDCVCDRLAGEHYLSTGDATCLIGLGWPRTVIEDLDEGDVTPTELLTIECQNGYQKRATPVDILVQSLW